MSSQAFRAFIRPGFNASVTEINTRSGPSTQYEVPFRAPTNSGDFEVVNVMPDEQGTTFNGKVYQWFHLAFGDGRSAWVRDDLIDVTGDGSRFGYGFVSGRMFAVELHRALADPNRAERAINTVSPPPEEERADNMLERMAEVAPQLSDDDRTVRAAFNITAAFEGSGYASYQTFDRGVVSYGRFQFTLLSGSLASVLNRYLALVDPNDFLGQTLRRDYQSAINERIESLREDTRLKSLLQRAAESPAMKQAQDEIAFEQYWQRMYELSVVPRNVQTPLAQALFFDISIQHGVFHNIFASAEEDLGVPPRSRVVENGIPEERFIARCAEVRRRILYRIADEQRLPGVRHRADFWIDIISTGDWQLQGDAQGHVNVLGRHVQVRNP